jgi:hypothetical protein
MISKGRSRELSDTKFHAEFVLGIDVHSRISKLPVPARFGRNAGGKSNSVSRGSARWKIRIDSKFEDFANLKVTPGVAPRTLVACSKKC